MEKEGEVWVEEEGEEESSNKTKKGGTTLKKNRASGSHCVQLMVL